MANVIIISIQCKEHAYFLRHQHAHTVGYVLGGIFSILNMHQPEHVFSSLVISLTKILKYLWRTSHLKRLQALQSVSVMSSGSPVR